jgi:hypothetical protein
MNVCHLSERIMMSDTERFSTSYNDDDVASIFLSQTMRKIPSLYSVVSSMIYQVSLHYLFRPHKSFSVINLAGTDITRNLKQIAICIHCNLSISFIPLLW